MTNFTKKEIINTFVKLLNEKEFDKIKITEIVKECGINRNTFYYHYEDINDLAKSFLDDLKEKIVDSCKDDEEKRKIKFVRAKEFLSQNRNAIYHIYNSTLKDYFEQDVYNAIEALIIWYKNENYRNINIDNEEEMFIIRFFTGAITSYMYYWLKIGMPFEPDRIINKMTSLLKSTFDSVFLNIEKK